MSTRADTEPVEVRHAVSQPRTVEGLPKILCVDDELPALSTLTRVLKQRFAVTTADNAIDALSLLERERDFAVVIADLNMPGMDGIEFLHRARKRSPMTARLALTRASGMGPTLPPGLVFRALVKPCPVGELVAMLDVAVVYHKLMATSLFRPIASPI
jgi:CheY-like chemotaxis protein